MAVFSNSLVRRSSGGGSRFFDLQEYWTQSDARPTRDEGLLLPPFPLTFVSSRGAQVEARAEPVTTSAEPVTKAGRSCFSASHGCWLTAMLLGYGLAARWQDFTAEDKAWFENCRAGLRTVEDVAVQEREVSGMHLPLRTIARLDHANVRNLNGVAGHFTS
jgi:hypothetical protein